VEGSVEATKKIVEKAPSSPPLTPKGGGQQGAKPFTLKTAGPLVKAKKAYWDPLEGREYPIIEYHKLPDIDIDSISGLSSAAEKIKEALDSGVRRILLVDPPGVGKSVLALGTTRRLGLPLFDVDSLSLRRMGGEAAGLLGEPSSVQPARVEHSYSITWSG
jgi:hypothetical protein